MDKTDRILLMYQLTNIIAELDLEHAERNGVHFNNGKAFIELMQNMLYFVNKHLWRPCSVEMPKSHDWVLVQVHDPDTEYIWISVGEYEEEENDWYVKGNGYQGNPAHYNVDAWMPLPEKWNGI